MRRVMGTSRGNDGGGIRPAGGSVKRRGVRSPPDAMNSTTRLAGSSGAAPGPAAPAPESPSVHGRWARAGVTTAFVAGTLCYLNALSGRFVFDDIGLIVNNESLREAATLRQLLLTDLWGAVGLDTGYYRPLAAVVF